MKRWLQLEELATVLCSVYLFSLLALPWWVYPVLFMAPDLSMIGLLAGRRVGAFTYNLMHHKGVALGLDVLGFLVGVPLLLLTGAIMLGHSRWIASWALA